jgi:hypothetical protein
MGLSVEAWIGIAAVAVALIGIFVGRALIARKNHVQKQTTLGGTSIQVGRDVNVRKD